MRRCLCIFVCVCILLLLASCGRENVISIEKGLSKQEEKEFVPSVPSVFLDDSVKRETEPPRVLLITPLNRTENVPISSLIAVTLSEKINAGEISVEGVKGTTQYFDETATMVFSPVEELLPETTYRAEVIGAEDLSGNIMGRFGWSFSTARKDITESATFSPTITLTFGEERGSKAKSIPRPEVFPDWTTYATFVVNFSDVPGDRLRFTGQYKIQKLYASPVEVRLLVGEIVVWKSDPSLSISYTDFDSGIQKYTKPSGLAKVELQIRGGYADSGAMVCSNVVIF